MSLNQHRATSLLRLFALALGLGLAFLVSGLGHAQVSLRAVLAGYTIYGLSTMLVTWYRRCSVGVLLALLAGDLLWLGAVGSFLSEGHAGEVAILPPLAFLAGYLVAVLVAVVGRRPTAGLLGTLAGAMIMGLATALFSTLQEAQPDIPVLLAQVGIMLTGGLLVAYVTGLIEEQSRRTQVTQRIDREMRTREAEAAELVTFTQSLAASGGLRELGEAVIRHLRCHLSVRARGIVLEAGGEGVALWEEAGSLDDGQVEQRRALLQSATVNAGRPMQIEHVEVQSIGSRLLPERLDFQTSVEIPVRAAGRVAGVIFVGDPRRGAVEERRLGVLADVARRAAEAVQRIERQGEVEQRRTALLLRQMREGVILLGADGRMLLANPAAREALGCSGASTPLPSAIGTVPLVELAQTPAGISRRFRARVQVHEGRLPVDLACTAVGILDGSSRIGTLVTLADVTEEERARDRLVQSEKLSLVGQTLAGVAHELNNPLTALIGYSELLAGRELEQGVKATLDKIREQATRATKIVKNLLSVARQRNPERSLVHIPDIVSSVVELFAYEARLGGVRIDVDVPADFPEILGDRHALQQVFVNLVQNALHALQGHEGEKAIRIQAHDLPDGPIITVADTGPGVPADLRNRVFQPFFTTKGEGKGTGLGLGLCRSIARDHGGELVLDDREDGGAVFTLRLPRGRPEGTGRRTRRPGGDAQRLPRPLDVLVVDDEKEVRESIVAQLGRLGCQVASTTSAAEALTRLQGRTFDAILSDVRMPGTSGLDLHQELRRHHPELAGRCILMSGDYTNEELLQGVRRTGRPLLEKPFTTDELADALNGLLEEQAEATREAEGLPTKGNGNGNPADGPPAYGVISRTL